MVGGLVTFDEHLVVTRVNPAALRLLRASPSSVGRPLSQVLPGPFADDLARAFQGSEPIISRRELEVALADGRSLVFGFVLSRIPPGEGRGAQGIVLFRDLTDERRLLSEQQRLNRLTTLGEFSAQVAHELRNPLTAMSSTVQYLAASSEGRDRELLRILTESIQRMEGIIRRMRLLSREMPLERTGIDLGDLVAHLLLFLDASLRSQGIAPVFRAPAAPVFVTGDPAQLHQALLNLLMNAMQAMPGGGRLRVRLARGLAPAGGGAAPALLMIADAGAGIPPEVAGRIFEPFYTTRQAGTGLGLPIADKIVREHGGSIRFTSRPGHGACFAVILPGAEGKGESWPAS
jgi:signal transduction histidine kinase